MIDSIWIVSAEQKEIGVKKDPTLQNTHAFSLCVSKVKWQWEDKILICDSIMHSFDRFENIHQFGILLG